MLALCAIPALAACATARRLQPRLEPVVREAAGSPQQVLTRIKLDAAGRGWRIADEGTDSLLVDFGTADARVRMPPASGSRETDSQPRLTEVHGSALYVVLPGPAGAEITVVENPIYWDLDLACWLPGPAGLLPSSELLPPDARGGTQ